MRGRKLEIAWREADDERALHAAYQRERVGEVRSRLHALWLLRAGKSLTETAAVVGAHYRTVQQWVAWYRAGGLAGVRAPRIGGRGGPARRLQPEHEAALVAQANAVGFATVAEAATWLEEQTGIRYSPWGMRWVLARLGLRPKVPRPLAAKASLEQQAAWKGGASRRP